MRKTRQRYNTTKATVSVRSILLRMKEGNFQETKIEADREKYDTYTFFLLLLLQVVSVHLSFVCNGSEEERERVMS